jgi:hypothetical protein
MTAETQLYYTNVLLRRNRQQDVVLKETPPDGAIILLPHKNNQVTDAEYPNRFTTALLMFGLCLVGMPFAATGVRGQSESWLCWLVGMNLFAPVSITFIRLAMAWGYDQLGFKRIVLTPAYDRIAVYHEIVWTWPLFLRMSVQRHASGLHDLRVQQTTRTWDWFAAPQPTLYLRLRHKDVPLPTGYTRDEYQQIQTFMRRYVVLFRQYIRVTHVVFDTSHEGSRQHKSLLWNPDVRNLTVPMPHLTCIQIHTESYDVHDVEQFMTYALTYLGQRSLQETVEAHIIGPLRLLHPNVRNTLRNVCKCLVVSQNTCAP